MGKDKLDTKTIRRYWKEVLRRAIKPALGEASMRVVVIIFLIALSIFIISLILTLLGIASVPFLVDRIKELQSISTNTLYVILALGVLVGIGIWRAAPEMHEELGGFVENQFILDKYKSKREKSKNEDKWASIKVTNKSDFQNINDCFLKLVDIIDLENGESIIEDELNLTWSGIEQNNKIKGNQPIRIFAANHAVCDVARTSISEPFNGEAYYTTWFGGQKIEKGQYSLFIIIYGNFENHPVHYKYKTTLFFAGSNKISIDTPILIQDK